MYRTTNNTNEIIIVDRVKANRGESLYKTYDEAWAAIYKRSLARYEEAFFELQLATDELELVSEMNEA